MTPFLVVPVVLAAALFASPADKELIVFRGTKREPVAAWYSPDGREQAAQTLPTQRFIVGRTGDTALIGEYHSGLDTLTRSGRLNPSPDNTVTPVRVFGDGVVEILHDAYRIKGREADYRVPRLTADYLSLIDERRSLAYVSPRRDQPYTFIRHNYRTNKSEQLRFRSEGPLHLYYYRPTLALVAPGIVVGFTAVGGWSTERLRLAPTLDLSDKDDEQDTEVRIVLTLFDCAKKKASPLAVVTVEEVEDQRSYHFDVPTIACFDGDLIAFLYYDVLVLTRVNLEDTTLRHPTLAPR